MFINFRLYSTDGPFHLLSLLKPCLCLLHPLLKLLHLLQKLLHASLGLLTLLYLLLHLLKHGVEPPLHLHHLLHYPSL